MSRDTGPIRNFDDEQLKKQLDAIHDRFSEHPLSEEQHDLFVELDEGFRNLAKKIGKLTPPGREQSTALTHLAEARFHAREAIALAGTKGA